MNMLFAALRCAAVVFPALLFGVSASAEAASPRVVVENFYSTLMGTMREADKLGFNGRVERLSPAIREAFDTPNMTRMAVGPRWTNVSDEQRQQLVDAFTRFIVATFANRFDGYSSEQFVIKNVSQGNDGAVIVESQMTRSDGDPVPFNYVLRQSDGHWRIADIMFGPVSELANRRAEFASVMRRDGVDGLINEIQRKTKDLENP
jgi:phospholipid transport system substrate-binding protein